MVAKPENDVTRDTMEKDLYINKQGSSIKSSPFYRYFFARDADFTIKENPFDKYACNMVKTDTMSITNPC